MVERAAVNRLVVGSNPTAGATHSLRMTRAQQPPSTSLLGSQTVEVVALRKGVVSDGTALAIRSMLTQRNGAAHGLDIDTSEAQFYATLGDAVITSIENSPPGDRDLAASDPEG